MHGEDSLDADSEADSTHCERFTQHFAATAHHHALEWLDTLFIAFAFFQADVDSNGIARAEFGEILAELRVLHTANYRFHFYLSMQTRSGGASLRRTISNFTEIWGFCIHEIANRVDCGGFSTRRNLSGRRKRAGETPALRSASVAISRSESGACDLLGSIRMIMGEEVGAVALGFFEGLLVATAADFFMVAAEENFGDVPAAE